MAKVRARPDNKMLFLDFFYRGVRCREQTTLPDTVVNRRRVQALMSRVSKEIKQGLFDYAATFPNSPKAAMFATDLAGETGAAVRRSTIAPAALDQSTPVTPTFAEFSETWRAEMAPQWRRQHRHSVDVIFDAHLLPAFGDKLLSVMTKADVLAHRAELAALPGRGNAHLSPATINKVMGILRQCMAEASERYQLPDHFRGIKRLKGQRSDVQPFSLEEVELIRSTIRADYRDYVIVRFFTGMRSGEVNGLKWKYVDLENGLILVRETFSAGQCEKNAKSESSLRDIPMLPMVKAALQSLRNDRHPDSEFVFCNRDGNPVDAHNFANRIWYPLLRYLELDKRRPYQTRHTAATLMLASGENPEWIARVLGHSNTDMLFRVYSRYVPNLTRQDGLAFAGLVNTQPGEASKQPNNVIHKLKEMSPEQLRDTLARLLAEGEERESRRRPAAAARRIQPTETQQNTKGATP